MPATKNKTTRPPAHVVAQIRRGDLLDGNALLAWYENGCPAWLKQVGVAPDLAVMLAAADLPEPTRWGHVGIVGRPT